MPRRVLIVTTILCLLAGGLGLWLGMLDAQRSETDIINSAAALWSEETGHSDVATCLGWMRFEDVSWLEVRCGMGDTERTYIFDEKGRLVRRSGPET